MAKELERNAAGLPIRELGMTDEMNFKTWEIYFYGMACFLSIIPL